MTEVEDRLDFELTKYISTSCPLGVSSGLSIVIIQEKIDQSYHNPPLYLETCNYHLHCYNCALFSSTRCLLTMPQGHWLKALKPLSCEVTWPHAGGHGPENYPQLSRVQLVNPLNTSPRYIGAKVGYHSASKVFCHLITPSHRQAKQLAKR